MRNKRWFKNCFVNEFDVLVLFLFFFNEAPISPFNVVVLMVNGALILLNDALPFPFW
jgi:hypothetical protein